MNPITYDANDGQALEHSARDHQRKFMGFNSLKSGAAHRSGLREFPENSPSQIDFLQTYMPVSASPARAGKEAETSQQLKEIDAPFLKKTDYSGPGLVGDTSHLSGLGPDFTSNPHLSHGYRGLPTEDSTVPGPRPTPRPPPFRTFYVDHQAPVPTETRSSTVGSMTLGRPNSVRPDSAATLTQPQLSRSSHQYYGPCVHRLPDDCQDQKETNIVGEEARTSSVGIPSTIPERPRRGVAGEDMESYIKRMEREVTGTSPAHNAPSPSLERFHQDTKAGSGQYYLDPLSPTKFSREKQSFPSAGPAPRHRFNFGHYPQLEQENHFGRRRAILKPEEPDVPINLSRFWRPNPFV